MNMFKTLMLVRSLMDSFADALEDQKITVKEALTIALELAEDLGYADHVIFEKDEED